MKVYSPATFCHACWSALKMERNRGSTSTVTSLLSPALSFTRLQPTRRLGGSPALDGNEA